MNCTSSLVAGSGSILEDDTIDPLMDDDWLHEHNLDVLFDLFEQELGMKDTISDDNSSSLFGSSPVATCLFGTSPLLVSALDIYDLIYSDCQQQQQPVSPTHMQQGQSTSDDQPKCNANSSPKTTATSNVGPIDEAQATTTATNSSTSSSPISITSTNKNSRSHTNSKNSEPKPNHSKTSSNLVNSMRFKRKLKKGQYEGMSLLARPTKSETSGSTNISNGCTGGPSKNIRAANNISGDIPRSATTVNFLTAATTISKGDKTTSTNIIDPIRFSGASIVDHSRQNANSSSLHCHHVHYITGYSITREHAYAVRGH